MTSGAVSSRRRATRSMRRRTELIFQEASLIGMRDQTDRRFARAAPERRVDPPDKRKRPVWGETGRPTLICAFRREGLPAGAIAPGWRRGHHGEKGASLDSEVWAGAAYSTHP